MFATDRDLLAYEPNLFRDVSWLGQRLFAGTCNLIGTTLTAAAADFAALGVEAGHVVVVDGASFEVLARTGATTLTVSRLRGSHDGAAIPPLPGTSRPLMVTTFAPQIGLAHRQALAMLDLRAAATSAEPDALTEAMVMNPGELRAWVALAALHLVYAALGAAAGKSDAAEPERAEMYRRRAAAERARAVARLDTDGDGVADTVRRPSVLTLVRV